MMSCPTCRKPTDTKYRPFCSKRCADADLGRWLNGSYAIAGSAEEDTVDPEQAGAEVIELAAVRLQRDG